MVLCMLMFIVYVYINRVNSIFLSCLLKVKLRLNPFNLIISAQADAEESEPVYINISEMRNDRGIHIGEIYIF